MDIVTYKCPSCNAPLKYSGKEDRMTCEYCENTFDIEAVKSYNETEKDIENGDVFEKYDESSGSGDWKEGEAEELAVFTCPTCGGELIVEATTAATSCPYCENPAMLSSRLSGTFRPDMVIPFKKTKEEAKEAFLLHCKNKILLPKSYKSESRLESIKGVYVPFWIFDCSCEMTANYNATKVRSWRQGDYRITQTDHFRIHRTGSMLFNSVPQDGSKKMEDRFMQAIEPYDMSEAVDFTTAYLSGYLADKYDEGSDECVSRVNSRINTTAASVLRDTVHGYATVSTASSGVKYKDSAVSYMLLPVWMLNTTYRNKTYTFAMNGQTGKFIGELPVSWGRFFGLFAGLTAAIGAVVSLIFFLMSL